MRTSYNLVALCALFVALVSVLSSSATTVPRSDILESLENSAAIERSTLEPEVQELESRATHSGRGTYFKPGLGACGWWSSSNDLIMAISGKAWGNGNKCGKTARVCSGGKCVNAKVVDMCPGCPRGALDLSPAAFRKLAPLSRGVVNVKWHFI